MSTNPLETAAIPSAIAVIDAITEFNANLGTDPAQWAIKVPGAIQVFLGRLSLQGPALAVAEGTAVITAANAKLAEWKAALQAKLSTPAS